MTEGRVLVVGDDYYASLAAVRALRAGGYEPWFAATVGETLAGCSRAIAGSIVVPHPEGGADAFVASVATAATRLRVDVVLPGTEVSLAALAGRDRDFAAALGAPSPASVERATDKVRLAGFVEEAGLCAPPGAVVSASSARPNLSFPVIVKAVQSTLQQEEHTVDLPATRRLDSADDLDSFLLTAPAADYLVQPYLDGTLGALAGVAWRGEIVCTSQQIARRIYPRHAGASSAAETVPVEAELRSAAQRILALLEWSGVWELQYIASAEARYAIDFNPRFYGSMALAVAAGLNLPSIWTDLLLGRPPRIGRYRPGTRYRAEVRDARALAEAGPRAALHGMLPHRNTAHAVWSFRDPLPLLALATRPWRRRRHRRRL